LFNTWSFKYPNFVKSEVKSIVLDQKVVVETQNAIPYLLHDAHNVVDKLTLHLLGVLWLHPVENIKIEGLHQTDR
jgi:hypothetical protein